PTPRDWFRAFALHRGEHDGSSGPLPRALFDRGEATYEALLRSSEPAVLLHGDLHHYNILSAQRAPWLEIDPHGLVGEPAFETGAFFGNPFDLLSRRDPARILKRRADILSERLGLGRAPERITTKLVERPWSDGPRSGIIHLHISGTRYRSGKQRRGRPTPFRKRSSVPIA